MKNIIKNTNKKGFTIVELVIVIAVIGILAAVLIPTFSNVIKNANESAALQEARNMYTEFLAEHPETEINYVELTGDNNAKTYYSISNWKTVTEVEIATGSSILKLKGTGNCGKSNCNCGYEVGVKAEKKPA